jgi:ParB family chromosome partitioning protein
MGPNMSVRKNPTSDAFALVSRKPSAQELLQARLKSQLAGGVGAVMASAAPASVPPPTVQAMQRSIEDLQAAGMRVDAIEALLAAGEHAVELDTESVDLSAVNDRFDGGEADEEFCASISAHGQIVPILVRPIEGQGGYQIVYGRRRLSAAKKLGIKVKAFIRRLTDDESVALQAIENAQRSDLTFIERAVFAFNLDDMGFKRDVIGSVLNISKSKLSEMISIPRDVGMDIIREIGAAKEGGYRPWMKLAHLSTATEGAKAKILELSKSDEFRASSSDARLHIAIARLSDRKSDRADPVLPLGTRAVTVRRNEKQTLIAIDRRTSGGFADFIEQQLPELFAAYQAEQPATD